MNTLTITQANLDGLLSQQEEALSSYQICHLFRATKPNQEKRLQTMLDKMVKQNKVILSKRQSTVAAMFGEVLAVKARMPTQTVTYMHVDAARRLMGAPC